MAENSEFQIPATPMKKKMREFMVKAQKVCLIYQPRVWGAKYTSTNANLAQLIRGCKI